MIRCCLRCNTRLYTEPVEGKYHFTCESCGYSWVEQAHVVKRPEGSEHGKGSR